MRPARLSTSGDKRNASAGPNRVFCWGSLLRSGWHVPCKRTCIRERRLRREPKSKTHQVNSHEVCNYKRVCFAGFDSAHRTIARARACPGNANTERRQWIVAIGTDSVWRSREWVQWLWPPHGPSSGSIAWTSRRATVKRGPYIMSVHQPSRAFFRSGGKRTNSKTQSPT